MSEPTQKQLDFIADIQMVVGVEFTGCSKEEASEYIDAHIGDFYREMNNEYMYHEAYMESQHGDWGDR